ncbi:precorrin-3B synthase [uncultured Friedmanniella sp.]|uniref:precorrin-3B synthase n=1 Tax=uncultured Friedmanniella sp. TaxID=335381 RepID=UPI0035CBDB2A
MTVDRCPGVLRPHQAADGAMVRIRIPGGQLTGTALAALGAAADTFGSGVLHLTSRASLQVRGLPPALPPAFEDAITAAGSLPSPTHERVRNVVCSPLTGLSGGRADLRSMVAALDRAVLAEPALALLSGRFLFGLDDGRGDTVALRPDLGYLALDPSRGRIVVGGRGREVPARDAVDELVGLALDFAAAAEPVGAWRVSDLPGWVAGLGGLESVSLPEAELMPLGAVGPHASVAVPLGFLAPEQWRAVVEAAEGGRVVVTPWRGLVVAGAADRLAGLAASGLVASSASPWTAISACVGAPWCAHGRVDTQALVRSAVDPALDDGAEAAWPRTHVSGCERRCGAPVGAHRDLVAPTRDQLLAEVLTHA